MGIFDIRKKNRQPAKESGGQEKLTAMVSRMAIEDGILIVEGRLQVSDAQHVRSMVYEMTGISHDISMRPEESCHEDGKILIPFTAEIPFPEEVEKVVFRVTLADDIQCKVVFSCVEKQDGRASAGEQCAWASKPDIICEPNIGDYRQAVAVHKLRRLVADGRDRLAVLRVPADRSRAFDMLEENVDRLTALLDGGAYDDSLSPDEIQLGVISYLNAALKKSVDFGREYTFDQTDYSSRWGKIRHLLAFVDDEMILDLRKTSRFVKIFFMQQKHANGCSYKAEGLDLRIIYGAQELYPLSDFDTVIFFVKTEKDVLTVEGAFHLPVCVDFDRFMPVALVDDTEIRMEVIPDMEDRRRFDQLYLKELGFKLEISKPDAQIMIRFGYRIDGHLVIARRLKYDPLLCPVSDDAGFGYSYENGMMIDAMTQMILCRPCDHQTAIEKREALLGEEALNDPELSAHEAQESLLIRGFYRLFRQGFDETVYQRMMTCLDDINEDDWAKAQALISRYARKDAPGRGRKVWLIMDRPDRADDNGEALFRYLMKEKPEGIDVFFVLQSGSSGYGDLGDIGSVIEPMSAAHRMLHVISQYVLSSQMAEYVLNPFGDQKKYVRDLCRKPEIVFLQHGVTYNHFGKLVGKYGRNFKGIVTNGEAESDYFKSGFFHYGGEEIWLTGFPRFDRLYDDNKKQITIMPTWRRWLTHRAYDPDIHMVSWIVNEDFEESEYFRFYEDLINDKRLLEAADQYGYHIAMLPHVMFMKQGQRFKHPALVKVFAYEEPYRKVFAESALIVTDYSSAVFDFAYMHKPVVYCQFDREAFYTRHSVRKGYFDFERDGFGEVTCDKESCVNTLIDYMKNGCLLKELYRERTDAFFTYTDDHCCERLLKKLYTI